MSCISQRESITAGCYLWYTWPKNTLVDSWSLYWAPNPRYGKYFVLDLSIYRSLIPAKINLLHTGLVKVLKPIKAYFHRVEEINTCQTASIEVEFICYLQYLSLIIFHRPHSKTCKCLNWFEYFICTRSPAPIRSSVSLHRNKWLCYMGTFRMDFLRQYNLTHINTHTSPKLA